MSKPAYEKPIVKITKAEKPAKQTGYTVAGGIVKPPMGGYNDDIGSYSYEY